MGTPSTWQDALLAGIRESGIEPLAELTSQIMRRQLSPLFEDEDLMGMARSSAVANVSLLVDLMEGRTELADIEPPREAAEFARELAHRNVPVSDLSRTYRLAQRTLWRWGVEQVHARIVHEDACMVAIEELSEAALATGDAMMSVTMDRYAVERDRWMRSADAVRRATVEAVLAGDSLNIDVASGRLRYELRRNHVAFVVWADPQVAPLEAAAAAVGGQHALLVPIGVGIVAGWCGPGSIDTRKADSAVSVALGTAAEGIDGFRRSHAEALETRRVARLGRMTGVLNYDDFALASLLTKDIDQARVFVQSVLGDLAGNGETARRLSATVLAVLEAQGSPRRAGRRLGIHENTVAKRLRSAEEKLGREIHERPAELMAALLLRRLVVTDAARPSEVGPRTPTALFDKRQ